MATRTNTPAGISNAPHAPSLLWHITHTEAPAAVWLIRLMVGAVFVSEGIQKFIDPAEVGAGRFAKIGLPSPEVLAPFVGVNEILFGSLVLLGLLTRLAVIPLLVIMAVAIVSTKVPMLLNKGFWAMAHGSRNDWAMTLGSLFLLMVGAGPKSLDAAIAAKAASGAQVPNAGTTRSGAG